MKISSLYIGQTIVEFLLAMALTAVFLPVLITSLTSSREGQAQDAKRLDAVQLHREAVEAVRSVRERNFEEISVNGTYHPQIQGSRWEIIPNSEQINGYTRSIIIGDVHRDGSGAIVTSGGTLDPSTKKINIVVSWSTPNQSTLESTLYLSRYENEVYTETTQQEFDEGQKTDVAVTNTAGGEIILGAGGHGDWCSPTSYIVDELNLQASGDARDVFAIEGKAFTGTHVGNSGKFYEIGISNTDPPNATVTRSINGTSTNDVFIDGQYAYIATGNVNKDISIIDLSTGQEVGYFDDSYFFGTAQGIWIKGNVGYTTIGFRLHTFDLSSKSGSRPEMDSLVMINNSTAYRIQVVGDYAYVALNNEDSEMRIFNVANPRDITDVGYANVNGKAGKEITVNETGTRAYLATESSATQNEFFIINTTNKNGSLPVIGSYNAGNTNPTGLNVVPGNIAIFVGTNGEEYQVLSIANETNPTRCGGMQVNSGIYGVSSVIESDFDAYSYLVTGDSSSEFKIIQGGPGGSFATSGTFTSRTFDAGSNVVFNRLIPNVTLPPQTNVEFQVGIAKAVNNSCNGVSYVYVGPNGTSSTYYSSSGGEIPIDQNGSGYENPGRCFRYKAYLSTTDFVSSPVVNDVSINYSP